ncbi:MAG: 4-(cytidine 5'-diphospho)-2-C-methyl-D-erythritol kinase [Flammeovirgaceae bacterium]|nr:4-(cytidine 5'-diphospho)-2-C-methyl-D-erythritol kinase [Flammeovirgaceae bacterium]
MHIIDRLPDGYHQIETCYYPVPWSDVLEVVPAEKFSFTSSGEIIPGNPEDNLCVKAYREIQKNHNLSPIAIHLHKIIPSGAGLGGGSSDASFCLRILNSVFDLSCTSEEMISYAGRLGSDCAFFLEDSPKIGTGKGDLLTRIDINLKNFYLVIIKPPLHISSSEAYGLITPSKPGTSIRNIIREIPITSWKKELVNNFEEPIFQKYPELKKIKDRLYLKGAVYASMSGSGSSLYGIFTSQIDLEKEFPGCNYWAGKL